MSEFTDAETAVLRALAQGILQAQRANGGTANGGQHQSPVSAGEALDDAQLEKPWANPEIRKDPPRYNGPSFVGRQYSEASAEWHTANASYMDWKGNKGKSETPVRMRNDGKPWYDSDFLMAKISRAWQRRNAGKPVAPTASAAPAYDASVDESDLPFATTSLLPHRAERMPRWMRR